MTLKNKSVTLFTAVFLCLGVTLCTLSAYAENVSENLSGTLPTEPSPVLQEQSESSLPSTGKEPGNTESAETDVETQNSTLTEGDNDPSVTTTTSKAQTTSTPQTSLPNITTAVTETETTTTTTTTTTTKKLIGLPKPVTNKPISLEPPFLSTLAPNTDTNIGESLPEQSGTTNPIKDNTASVSQSENNNQITHESSAAVIISPGFFKVSAVICLLFALGGGVWLLLGRSDY